MKRTLPLFFLLILFSALHTQAQNAETHYIAPSPWQYWSDANEIVVSTQEAGPLSVELKKSDGTPLTTLSVTAAAPVSYRFVGNPVTTPRNNTNTNYNDRGLIVTATGPVAINMRNIASDAPGTSVTNIKGNASLVSFGNEGLGLSFRLGYYRSSYTGISGGAPLYAVMAVQDATVVSLNGVVLTTLNAGQSRLFTAPMGALLSADKAVVANTGTYGDTPQACEGNGEDGSVDQIAPVNKLGMLYMLVRGNGTAGTGPNHPEQSTIIASQANTIVNVINYNAAGTQISTATYNLANAGSYVSIHHGDAATIYSSSFVNADKPVVVYSATAVDCESDVSTVLPIGGCAGSTKITTRKFISYNNTNLSYFGYTILESATEPVFINGANMEVVTGISRIQIGTTGFYMIRFTNATIGNPVVIKITSAARMTTSIIQQGEGFSMSGFFSAFNDSPSPPTEVISPDMCQTTLSTTAGLEPYQWYLDGVAIPGATAETYDIQASGNYTVIGTRSCGLTAPSAPVFVNHTTCIDLEVQKEVAAVAGNQATFLITAVNNGTNADTNVVVTDLLPSGYTFVSATPSVGTYSATTGLWTIGNLAVNSPVTLVVVATMNATGDFVNIATITGTNPDPDPANNTAQAIAHLSSMSLTKAASQLVYYNEGEVVAYNLVLTNTGQTQLTAVTVTDTNADAGSINPGVIPVLVPGQAVTVTATHTITAADVLAGFVSNQATVTGQSPDAQAITTISDDPSTPALLDSTLVTVTTTADLVTVKTNNQTVYVPGSTVTYTITITNNGPSNAHDIQVADALPAGITQMSWTGNGTGGTGALSDVIPMLANGSSSTYTVSIEVPDSYTGNLVNTVNVTSPTLDPDPSCPQCTDTDVQCTGPAVGTPQPLLVCDAGVQDGLAEVDLSQKSNEITAGNAALQVLYYEDATAQANGTPIADAQHFTTTIPNSQTLIVEVIDAVGCKSYTTLEIQVIGSPAPLPPLVKDSCNVNQNSFDLTVYAGALLGTQPALTLAGYFTTLTNAQNGSPAITTPNAYTITGTNATIYVRIENATGCYTVRELRITSIPPIVVDLEDSYPVCLDANGNVMQNATIDTGFPAAGYTFEWRYNGQLMTQNGPMISVSAGGNYAVTIFSPYGCPSATATTTVVVSSGPETFTAAVVSGYFSDDATIQAVATGTGDFVYWLDNGPEQYNNYFHQVSSGLHEVHVKDAQGCGHTLTVRVMVIDYPKYFTPNGDGYHDHWNIWSLRDQKAAIIYIFDRYEKLITAIKPSGAGWDGTFNGQPLPSTDYWFKVIFTENQTQREFKAHFSLVR